MLSHILECKQCGAEVSCEGGVKVVVCPYCSSQNTVAKTIEVQGGLVNRANYLRRNNEFDKALGVYEEILRIDNTDYEAHWGTVLCRYGIEYIDDPATHRMLPTCHRTLSESIYTDTSYKAAIEYASPDVREVYEREAAQINSIQKNIIALAQKQEHYDVFICYKEEDDGGNRTEDSVIAQELEFELSKRGYKVFFARKTLAHTLGSEYEPIIYAALQSTKVMVVPGTCPQHFGAVWVKNEWSRYREMISKGAQKVLIPAYRGMSPYDLPQEFSNLQALDMNKLGFVQDLCDGIDRFTRSPQRQIAPYHTPTVPTAEPLLKRAFIFVEDGNFAKAGEYFERVLDMNPEEPHAYFGRWLIEIKARNAGQTVDRLLFIFAGELAGFIFSGLGADRLVDAAVQSAEQLKTLSRYTNFNMAMRFSTTDLQRQYENCKNSIIDQINQVVSTIKEAYQDSRTICTDLTRARYPMFWSYVDAELGRMQAEKREEDEMKAAERKAQQEALERQMSAQKQNLAQQQPVNEPQKSSGQGCLITIVLGIPIAILLYIFIKILI